MNFTDLPTTPVHIPDPLIPVILSVGYETCADILRELAPDENNFTPDEQPKANFTYHCIATALNLIINATPTEAETTSSTSPSITVPLNRAQLAALIGTLAFLGTHPLQDPRGKVLLQGTQHALEHFLTPLPKLSQDEHAALLLTTPPLPPTQLPELPATRPNSTRWELLPIGTPGNGNVGAEVTGHA